MTSAGFRFDVRPSDVDEEVAPGLSPDDVVLQLALRKAKDVAARNTDRIVIGADTIVVADGRILGKPVDRDDAGETLRMLSGRSHDVKTAVALVWGDRTETAVENTVVTFRDIDDAERETYLDTTEPYDKAGAYGIQGRAALFVERIDGCFYNVVGFPLTRFWILLNRLTDNGGERYRDSAPTPDFLALGG